MKTLLDLYKTHTGKVSDKWELFLLEYDRLFAPYREKSISMMEIGIQNGGSLEIWSQYFLNAQKFVGCDINPDCANLTYEDPRIAVIVGDATTPETQAKVFEQSAEFDLIIDDGSHTSHDIVKAFARYFPALKTGGLFVAEDLHCSYWQQYEGGLFHPNSSITFFKYLADIINYEHWGVEKSRTELVAGFKQVFNVDFDESLLEQVSSVEFINSLCVIRKSDMMSNRLGSRLIAGVKEIVHQGVVSTFPRESKATVQTLNKWSNLVKSPLESYQELVDEINIGKDLITQQLKDLEKLRGEIQVIQNEINIGKDHSAQQLKELEKLRGEMQVIQNSRSWRYTASLRRVGSLARKVYSLWRRIKKTAQQSGGYANLVSKFKDIVSNEGWQGISRRLSNTENVRLVVLPDGQTVKCNDYQAWIKLFDTLDSEAVERIKVEIAGFSTCPKISIVMPVYNAPLKFLEEAIQSVQNQIYENWELCIADDASTNKDIKILLERYLAQDERIKVVLRPQNGHISAASNSALELATGEYIALLDQDDLLTQHALFHVVQTIHANPNVALIYSDEDKVNKYGKRYNPYFKPDFNYELQLAHNMISHLGVYSRALVKEIGGFRLGYEGAQDYDLALRVIERVQPQQVVHIPRILYHWRAIPGSTALGAGEKDYAVEAARKVITEHLRRIGREGIVTAAPEINSMHRVKYELPSAPPMVTIIIPTRDHSEVLAVCLSSVLTKTAYANYEIIIVDNGSVKKETFDLFAAQPKDKVSVIRDDLPFNFSRLNNLALQQARGELLCMMNNDIEVLNADWLEEMVSFAHQSDIGCVGARLWYPDGRLQHAGIVLGIGGVAGHAHKYISKQDYGYFSRAALHQEYSAVTAACLLVRRSVWMQVCGLDESFAVAFNDVDFCLRVREAGYRNVWTPYAEMIHHESISRGYEDTPEKVARFQKEIEQMQVRWGDLLMHDPAYNPNLTLDYEDFSLNWSSIQ